MAIDWTRGMRQEFGFCEVDPLTWHDARDLREVSSCVVTRDLSKRTWESGTIEVSDSGWLSGERIVRCYLTATQGGESERVCVATLAFQGETAERDGATSATSAEGYGLLQDLAVEPPFGYCASGDPSDAIARIVSDSTCRAPYVGRDGLAALDAPMWPNDSDLFCDLAAAVAERAGCGLVTDELGRVTLVPTRATEALRPSWTFGRDNCIIRPRVTRRTDLFGIPNWCEVTVSDGLSTVVGTAENDEPASPTSTARRGHRVPLRASNPAGLSPRCTKAEADAFAARMLAEASVVTTTWEYSHAWVPIRPGDAVLLDVDGMGPVVAKVESQEIVLQTGVEVRETATSTERTWGS